MKKGETRRSIRRESRRVVLKPREEGKKQPLVGSWRRRQTETEERELKREGDEYISRAMNKLFHG